VRRNYSNQEIQNILGGNFARVLAQIWTVEKVEKKETG